ncbi:MAG: carboxypeptidase regulatory-like domain-containing protein [Abitibacteriaceae bacterium]|nr:carboxypeptidase regulatory-like domain-containing protein [Abditibacteriaceae bacterium]
MKRLRLIFCVLLVLPMIKGVLARQQALSRRVSSLRTLALNSPVVFTIDATAPKHAISPLIYGVNNSSQGVLTDLNATVNRWGGTPKGTYNWQANAYNVGNDYFFESVQATGGAVAGGEPDLHVAASQGAGAASFLTVPMLSRLAKLGPNNSTLWSYSVAKYGAQQYADGDAGNGVKPDGTTLITNSDPNDASIAVTPATYQASWLTHLVGKWGTASNGGVSFYGMDNEPGIWHQTHRDVHPQGASMDEVAAATEAVSNAVHTADPSAQVLAPIEWNYEGYFSSGKDLQAYPNHPDRDAHGGMDYIPWLLQHWKTDDNNTGHHTLNYLAVNYYPSGGEFPNDGGPDDVSRNTQLLRNRSTRSLWDPNYVDESYIADQGPPNNVVQLIPRLKGWVNAYYPGLKTGLSEYSWGAEGHISGAIAQADVLGIFGREGLDMACRWEAPAQGTPTYNAFKMYRNYDGQKSTFGEMSMAVSTAANPDSCVAFAAQRSADGAITIMVINKDLDNSTPITVNVLNSAFNNAQVFQLTAANAITRQTDVPINNNTLTTVLPNQSITLFVLNTVTTAPTPTPLSTATPLPTATPVPTATPLPTATPIPTATPVPTVTPAPTATPVPGATPSPSLRLNITPATVREDAGTEAALGTVSLPAATTTPVTISLSSSNPGTAKVPASITLPLGATSAPFNIAAIDNAIVDGPRTVTITASALGFNATTATLTVTDNDTPTLTLTSSTDHFSEATPGTAATVTVRRNTSTAGALVVNLSSSNTAKAKVPLQVTIPPGASGATFSVTAVNNAVADGPVRVTLSARATGFPTSSLDVTVLDDEPASKLTISGHITAAVFNANGSSTRAPVPGVSVSLFSGTTLRDVVTTNTAGLYQFLRLPPGTYKIVPTRANFSFGPAFRALTLTTGNVVTADFDTTPRGQISGRVTRRLSNGTLQSLAGITLTARFAQHIFTARTNTGGNFLFDNLPLASYTVLPSVTGTYFQPRLLTVVLSPGVPTQRAANFTVAGTDTIKPTVAVTAPRAGTFTATQQLTTATGTAHDTGAAGPALVTVALARFASATGTTPTGFYNWTTNSFITGDNSSLVEKLASGTTVWSLKGVPVLPSGFYGLRATVTDAAGNSTRSAFVRWRVAPLATP